jgi:hypothetical protein
VWLNYLRNLVPEVSCLANFPRIESYRQCLEDRSARQFGRHCLQKLQTSFCLIFSSISVSDGPMEGNRRYMRSLCHGQGCIEKVLPGEKIRGSVAFFVIILLDEK